MGIFDKAKEALSGVTDKAEDLRETVGGVVEEGIDKAADMANSATGGKFEDQIEKVKDLADKIDGQVDDAADAATEAVADAAEAAEEAVDRIPTGWGRRRSTRHRRWRRCARSTAPGSTSTGR